MTPTNWDEYYARQTPGYTTISRRISQSKLIGILRERFGDQPIDICELGGANSCFLDGVLGTLAVKSYHVVDNNDYGLRMLSGKRFTAPLSIENSDVLKQYTGQQYDLVYSVGLIEHFDKAGTAKAIEGHFARCKPGGLVLITFPTPVLPYRIIRRAAELARVWAFPDERPLLFNEVSGECARHGTVEHESINWWIGLAQGYVGTRRAIQHP